MRSCSHPPPPPCSLLPAPLPILLLPPFFTSILPSSSFFLLFPSSFQNDPISDQQGGEPSLGQADDSLVDFGDDQEEEFDPLKRTNSLTSSHKTTQPPAVNSDLIGQLAGLDLNSTTTEGDNILQPSQTTSQPISLQPTQTASAISIPPFQMRGVAFPMPTTHPMYGAVMYPHAPGVVYMQQVGG